jgi:hypothetical protein
MANELVIHHPTGATLYALLFDATGQIYNGSTFGAPSSASWTGYGIAMSEAATATGIYRADMPAVAAGAYGWVVRKQAGGSPAVGDIAVGAGSIRWTGTAEEAVPAAVNVTYSAGVALAGRLAENADVSPLALEATAQAILEDTGTTLPALLTSTLASFVNTYSTDATTAGSITRRRGDSWAIVPAALGVLTGYTSLWLTIKRSHDDVDSASVLHVKKNASGLLDGLLYLNGAASTSNLASITVTDALTGVISIAVDEAATKELAPGEYCYDVQTLIAGDVATPDSGTFTVTADVTRSVT